mgnify:CR=1 FL=1
MVALDVLPHYRFSQKTMRNIGRLIPLLILALTIGCDKKILIGVSLPLSGPNAETGKEMLQAVQLHVDSINEKGGIGGKKVGLVIKDDEDDPAVSVSETSLRAFDLIREFARREKPSKLRAAVDLVNNSLGELVGQAYVEKHFPPIAKTRMEDLVGNLKVAMAGRIKTNSWMSEPTKQAALEKLAKMDVMVGYPDKWRDYSGVKVDAADLYGSVASATRFNADYQMSQLGKPVDRKLWGMFPQTVNAYNGGLENKIVFPAGILQAPFFDLNADMAVNYGAIGVVIGHEISHGFDDQGRKIDATGAVRDWWTPADAERFNAEAKIFGAQYAAFEVVPGAHINPELTMGENIADFAGLNVAYDAYHHALGGKEAPVIDGLTGDQRFFLAYAQVWKSKAREDSLRNQVTTDPHSPARYRTIAPIRNLEAWYQAFGIQPGDKMYIPPEKRAKIW